MARFYLLKVGDIYLTETGLVNGNPCKLQISGAEDLLTPITGSVVIAGDGTPVFQLAPWTRGKQFEVNVEAMPEAIWNSLKTLLLESLTLQTDFEITGTGDIGDFTVTARAFPNKPFSALNFRNGRIKNAVLRFITI